MGKLVALVVYFLANAVFVRCLREDEHSFRRIAAFLLGFPLTVFFALWVPRIERDYLPPPSREESDADDLRRLHRELQMDRRRRDLEAGPEDPDGAAV